jgi:ABC-2 type transport system permease protein
MSDASGQSTADNSTHQGWLFQRLRWRQLRNAAKDLTGTLRLRLVSIVICSFIVAGTVAVGSWYGFNLLETNRIPSAGGIIGLLFDFLFLSLGVLLFFSTGIIVYGSLFHSPETAFLLSVPARADNVFAYKFQTAIGFSSWAFLLLGLPILLAYGVVYAVSWHFFLLLPVFLIGFVLLPAALGATACMLIVNFIPQRRKQVLAAIILVLVAFVAWRSAIAVQFVRSSIGRPNRDALNQLFSQFEFASSPYAPSHWMTRGLQNAARGDLRSVALPLALIWSNGLFAYVVAAAAARRLYRRGFNRIATGASLRKRYGGSRIDEVFAWLLRVFPWQTRVLIIKDFRTFRRDPAQWAQILIFAGLVMLYIVNSRQFYEADLGERFSHIISLVNLCATSMLMCAFMGRFIYPLVSLEGKKFWILGLLPISRDRLLWGKFYFAAFGSCLIALTLVAVSDLLLAVRWKAILLHLLTVIILSGGLSGLSVGLGAMLPNFRETDPSKIAVGFGGTLNLIAGLMYLLLTIGIMALPYHVHIVLKTDEGDPFRIHWVFLGILVGIIVGGLAIWLPLRAGVANLRKMEF